MGRGQCRCSRPVQAKSSIASEWKRGEPPHLEINHSTRAPLDARMALLLQGVKKFLSALCCLRVPWIRTTTLGGGLPWRSGRWPTHRIQGCGGKGGGVSVLSESIQNHGFGLRPRDVFRFGVQGQPALGTRGRHARAHTEELAVWLEAGLVSGLRGRWVGGRGAGAAALLQRAAPAFPA